MRGIDEVAVTAWMVDQVGVTPPLAFALIAGGRSNLTFAVTDADGQALVLRRPPVGKTLATAHDMAREHRIITALGGTDVPVPRTRGLCEDLSVNEAPFYVMDRVGGVVLESVEAGASVADADRRPLAFALLDVLCALHDVDIDAVGLGDLSSRESYVERQLRRWSRQWEASKTREVPEVEEVERRLRAGVPAQQRVVVAHGDYRFGNCLVTPEAHRVEAVLDWELCTLGDPIADLGYLGVWWCDTATADTLDPTGAGGYPTHGELVERYADRTGLDTSAIDYYVAFSAWRLAIISEGVYARYKGGQMADDADLDVLASGTVTRARMALGRLGA